MSGSLSDQETERHVRRLRERAIQRRARRLLARPASPLDERVSSALAMLLEHMVSDLGDQGLAFARARQAGAGHVAREGQRLQRLIERRNQSVQKIEERIQAGLAVNEEAARNLPALSRYGEALDRLRVLLDRVERSWATTGANRGRDLRAFIACARLAQAGKAGPVRSDAKERPRSPRIARGAR